MGFHQISVVDMFLILLGVVFTQGFVFPEDYSEVSSPWNEAPSYRSVRDTLLRDKIMRDGYEDVKVPKYMLLQYSSPKTSKALLNDIPEGREGKDLIPENRESNDPKTAGTVQSQTNQGANPVLPSLAISPLGLSTIVSLLAGGNQLPVMPLSLALPLTPQTGGQLYSPYPLNLPYNTPPFPQYLTSLPLNQPLPRPFPDPAGRNINNGLNPFINSFHPSYTNPGIPYNIPNYQVPNSNYQIPNQNFQLPNQNMQSPLTTFNPWLSNPRPGFLGPFNGNMYPMGNMMNSPSRYPYHQMTHREDEE